MQDEEVRREAELRVHEKMEFYRHLGAFVVVNGVLFGINHFVTPEKQWFFWVLGGWGIGMVIHAAVYLTARRATAWKSRMVAKEAERIKNDLQTETIPQQAR